MKNHNTKCWLLSWFTGGRGRVDSIGPSRPGSQLGGTSRSDTINLRGAKTL